MITIRIANTTAGVQSVPSWSPRNSPESEIFNKRALLYGLNWAKNAIRKADRVFIESLSPEARRFRFLGQLRCPSEPLLEDTVSQLEVLITLQFNVVEPTARIRRSVRMRKLVQNGIITSMSSRFRRFSCARAIASRTIATAAERGSGAHDWPRPRISSASRGCEPSCRASRAGSRAWRGARRRG